MFRRHFSDDMLVSRLEGELRPAQDARVRDHLGKCRRCRTKSLELQREMQGLAVSLGDGSDPDPAWAASAKLRFTEWRRGFDTELAARAARRQARWAWGVAPVATALCAVFVIGLWLAFRSEKPMAGELLSASRTVEKRSFNQPLEQTFRVEAADLRPDGEIRSSRLSVWSDAGDGRFATRWVDSDGRLKYAAWQPGPGRELTYNPAVSVNAGPRVVQPGTAVSLAEVSLPGPDLSRIESAFIRWLDSRTWTPISLSDDFLAFTGGGGMTVSAERIRTRAGGTIRVTAVRRTARGTVTVMLDVNAATHSTLRLVARVETGGRSAELRLSPERTRILAAADLPDTIFEPAARFTNTVPARKPPIPPVLPMAPEKPGVTSPSFEDLEVSAIYALHGMHACLGEPIEVVRETGELVVRGVAESPERRDQLVAGLSVLGARAPVRLDIRTVAEEAGDAATSAYIPVQSAPSLSAPVAAIAERLPIEDRLVQYFSEHPGAALDAGLGPDAGHAAVALANQAVTASRMLSSDAWAVRRLAERYGNGRSAGLSGHSRQLLLSMIRDHLGSVQARAASADRLIRAPLTGMFGGGSAAGDSIPDAGGGWSAAALSLFAGVDAIEDHTLWLFSTQIRGTQIHNSETADAVARKLMLELSRVEEQLEMVQRALVSDFEREPGRVAAHESPAR